METLTDAEKNLGVVAEGHRFHPPLDVASVNTCQHVWGKFLKDYRETDW
jgi:hypothetical protein